MSKKAPVRCAASFKETYKGVWGDFPNKQNGTPRRCPVFCLWRPKGIACYNLLYIKEADTASLGIGSSKISEVLSLMLLSYPAYRY